MSFGEDIEETGKVQAVGPTFLWRREEMHVSAIFEPGTKSSPGLLPSRANGPLRPSVLSVSILPDTTES